MDTILKDIRYAVRSFRKNPIFTFVAVITLALGIGANTAIFSLVNTVLLKPLPLPDSDRVVTLWEDLSAIGFPRSEVAVGTYNDWKNQQSVFENVAAMEWRSYNLTGEGEPEKVSAYGVTANFFDLVGIQPSLGRTFSPDEDRSEGPKVAILSFGLWQRRFGGQRDILNREILLNGEKYSVIGVMPKGFQFMASYVGIWTPAGFNQKQLANYGNHYINVVARMKPGVTLDQASADIKTITQRIAADHPDDTEMGAAIVPLRELVTGESRRPLILLLVAVLMVLLITCANIASLLLSRATARRKEIAVRSALGASRFRVMRQLLTESIILALLGGLLGLIFSSWSFSFLKQLIPEGMVAATTLKIDLSVLAYSAAASLLTGIIFGLAPALQLSKIDLNEALKQSNTRTGSSAMQQRLRGAIIVGQIALALVLLVGAGLLMQTVFNLHQQYSGFQPDKVLTMRTQLPWNQYGERYRRVAFYDAVLERVRSIPGVTAAGYTTSVPLQWKGGFSDFTIEGQEHLTAPIAINRQVSIEYLQTMGIGLRQGRYFEGTDRKGSIPVAIVNETFARAYWPNESALGKRMKLGGQDAPWITITGIVNDVRQMGMDAPVKPEMYFPYQQSHFGYHPRDLVVRTAGDPMGVVDAVRREVHAVDPDQPISNIATMEELLTEETGPRRVGTILLSAFAVFALVLASLGIYGVLSYFVTQQTPELGVRMALGAQRKNILRLVLGKGLRLVLGGVFVGLAAAFALTRLIASLLFGVSATDPFTFVVIPLVLIGVSLLACYIPARRATKVDPLVALRYE